MKVLALGGLWVPYIKNNWFDAMHHVLGDDVLCVNAAPLLVNKEKFTGQPEGMHCAYIYDLLRREKFDYLFFYHDWIFGDYPDEFFDKVRAAGVKTITFHPDDEPEHWYSRNIAYDHHYDIVASHSSAGVKRRQLNGWGERVMYLPWGYNPRSCYAIPASSKRYDVIFFGKHKVNDQQGEAYVEDGLQRENILVQLADLCANEGWNFTVFGFGWDQHPKLKGYSGGIPSQEEMVQILNETKIVFNPAWSSDGDSFAVQTKLRHFEVPGCGAFQITNENPELAELFEPDKEIVFYRSNEDLFNKVKYYLLEDAKRDDIARAGHKRALNDHTLDDRINDLFRRVQKIYPAKLGQTFSMPVIKQLKIHNTKELLQLSEQLDDSSSLLNDCDWVHVIAGQFQSTIIDYTVLRPFFNSISDEILCASTYVDFEGGTINPLQPKLIENHSCVIGKDFYTDSFDFSLLADGCDLFVGVELLGVAHLLINYIMPKQHAKKVIQAFANSSFDAINQINTVSTGRIVSEVKLRLPEGLEPNWPSFESFEYVKRLHVLLPYFNAQNWTVVVYGISGMGEVTLKLLEQEKGLSLVGIIDRSLTATHFNKVPVIEVCDLSEVIPSVIILTSGASGASIYSSIKHLEGSVCILPLYDLDHPVWSILGL